MKFIKRIFIFLIFLAVAFFSLGFLFPSYSFDSSVTVNSPLVHSFPVFTDISKMPKWMNGFRKIESISGLPFQLGSKWKLTITKDGKDEVMIQTFTQYKKFEEFSFIIENDMFSNDVHIIFSEKDGKTIITVHNKFSGKNMFWRSAFVFAHGRIKDSQQEIYDGLKKVIEETPLMGAPTHDY